MASFLTGEIVNKDRIRLDIEFESGKVGFYDFSSVQYHSLIRSTGYRIQGTKGKSKMAKLPVWTIGTT